MIGKTLVVASLLALTLGNTMSAQTAEQTTQVRVRYIVNDVPISVTFYTSQLGFRLDAQFGPYFAALSRGGVQLLLSPVSGPGGASQPMPNGERPAPGGWNRLVVDTMDLQAEIERLRKQGVHFRNELTIGLGGNQILFDDPSGNVIELFQPTAVFTPKTN